MARYDAGYRRGGPRGSRPGNREWPNRSERSNPFGAAPGPRGSRYDREYGPYGPGEATWWSRRGGGYESDYRGRRDRRGGWGGTYNDYNRDYNARGGYGRDYNRKSRWETDRGDPFNDRGRNTPVRMMRGEWRNRGGYDRDYNRNRSGGRYGREYRRGYSREFRPRGRGY